MIQDEHSNLASDHSLLTSAVAGDRAALDTLMGRYDRLVRFTIYRCSKRQCLRDPQWLDTVASDTWVGVLRSFGRDIEKRTQSLSAYLTAIARFQTLTAIRQARKRGILETMPGDSELGAGDDGKVDSVESAATEFESIIVLRAALADLPESDKVILSQLEAITSRRWVDAGNALGMSESTLRSRWKRVLDRIRGAVAGTFHGRFAPDEEKRD